MIQHQYGIVNVIEKHSMEVLTDSEIKTFLIFTTFVTVSNQMQYFCLKMMISRTYIQQQENVYFGFEHWKFHFPYGCQHIAA